MGDPVPLLNVPDDDRSPYLPALEGLVRAFPCAEGTLLPLLLLLTALPDLPALDARGVFSSRLSVDVVAACREPPTGVPRLADRLLADKDRLLAEEDGTGLSIVLDGDLSAIKAPALREGLESDRAIILLPFPTRLAGGGVLDRGATAD